MPVSTKQVRVLNEHFGLAAATEIVDVLNNVESTSLAEIRSQIALGFAEVEAKLETALETKLEAKLDAKLDLRFAQYDAKMSERFLVHTRWMLGAQTTILLAILSLWFRK